MNKLKLSSTAGAAVAVIFAVSSSAVAQNATQSAQARSAAACDTVAMLRDSTMVDPSRKSRLNASCGQNRLATSVRRIPITKGETAMRADTVVRVDTVTVTKVDTVASAPIHDTVTVTVVDTIKSAAGEVVAPPVVVRRYSNGFYFGIGGGATMPTGGIRDAYNAGYNVTVPLGWDSQTGPFGLRLDLTYDQMHARSTFRSSNDLPTAVALTTVNPQIWSGMADVKLRLPFSGQFAGATTGLYVLGGVGAHYLRNYGQTFAVTNPGTNITDEGTSATLSDNGSLWRFGANAGGGISFGFGNNTSLFVESRYVRMFTSHERTNYVPVVVGLSFR
jgi:opacity protein-like surface antigen